MPLDVHLNQQKSSFLTDKDRHFLAQYSVEFGALLGQTYLNYAVDHTPRLIKIKCSLILQAHLTESI